MIKGVNRKIIEVNNPDSPYFEKAVLYLKPNIAVLHEAVSKKEAQRLIRSLTFDDTEKLQKKRRRKYLLAALMIIAAVVLFMLMK